MLADTQELRRGMDLAEGRLLGFTDACVGQHPFFDVFSVATVDVGICLLVAL